jgi:DNA polymerase-1
LKIFAFDTETFLIQPGKHIPKGVLAAWAVGEPTGPVDIGLAHLNPRFGDREVAHEMLRWGLCADIVSGAHVAYDMAVIAQEFPDLWLEVWRAYREGRVWDVILTEKLIAIGKGELKFRILATGQALKRDWSLAGIVKDRFEIVLDKDTWRLLYGTFYDTPPSEMPHGAKEYALLDGATTHLATSAQVRENPRYLVDASRQARAGWWMHLMSAHGFRVDPIAVRALETHVRDELGKISALLCNAGLVDKKGKRNTKAAGERMRAMCIAKGLKVPETPTGKVQLSDEVCMETGDPLLESYANYTSLMGVLNKDVKALKEAADAGMPIQSKFDPLKETGRTGSSGGKQKKGEKADKTAFSFQLQNVRRDPKPDKDGRYPPTVRGCFVPRRGYHLLSIDYGQMELHAWAQVCLDLLGFSDLAKMLNAGVDVHCKLGAMAIGRTYEEVFANRKKEAWAKDARQMSKAGNFGFPGGLGAARFQAYAKASWGVELTEEEAIELRNLWFAMLSEAKPYFELIGRLTGEGSDCEIVQTRSNRVRGGVGFTDAANGFFQALAADCAKDAGFDLSECCYTMPSSPLFGSRIVNFIHDEFLFEVPIDRAHEAAWAANEIMEAAGRRWMPDCPPRSVPALMERWYKDAEDVYENGRLTVWRPKMLGLMDGVA